MTSTRCVAVKHADVKGTTGQDDGLLGYTKASTVYLSLNKGLSLIVFNGKNCFCPDGKHQMENSYWP